MAPIKARYNPLLTLQLFLLIADHTDGAAACLQASWKGFRSYMTQLYNKVDELMEKDVDEYCIGGCLDV